MKAVIPTAGQGTRLYPQTHTKPKSLVSMAGQPILGHILSDLRRTPIEEVVVVVGGPMKNQVVEYAQASYGEDFSFSFVEQETPEGLGHAVYQAHDVAAGDSLFVVLGDMLFESGYNSFLQAHGAFESVDGSIGIKPVADPSHYGVVTTDADGRVTDLVEKPDDPPSDQAISGVYVVENSELLFRTLGRLIDENRRGAGGEFQLTAALQSMVEAGATLQTFEVEDWYDCGRPETLLEANRILLDRTPTDVTAEMQDAVVVDPVDLGANVRLTESIVGPYVSVADGAEITDSIIKDSVVGTAASISEVSIEGSIIGDNADIDGKTNRLNVGDNSNISL